MDVRFARNAFTLLAITGTGWPLVPGVGMGEHTKRTWVGRAFLASLLSSVAVIGAAGPAESASIVPTCDAFVLDAAGNPTDGDANTPGLQPAATGQTLPALTISDLGAGIGPVETGTAFDLTSPESTGPPLPTITKVKVGTVELDATVIEIKNIALTFATAGGATIGTPVLTGGNIVGATTTVNGTNIVLTLPGTQTGSSFPATGGSFFPAGSTFTTPAISIPVVAPGSPGTLTTSLTTLSLDTRVHLGDPNAPIDARLNCTAPANTLASIEVIAEQPVAAGAPDAKNDNQTTNKDTPVTIPVLTNDITDPGGRLIDNASLSITTAPAKGTAVANADGTVTYTPNPGATGTDSFRYQICSADDPELGDGPCDTAQVSVTVIDQAAAAAATTTTTVAATTTTTVAAAAAAAPTQLPRTGQASRLFATLGVVTVLLGSAALVVFQRRKTPRWLDD